MKSQILLGHLLERDLLDLRENEKAINGLLRKYGEEMAVRRVFLKIVGVGT